MNDFRIHTAANGFKRTRGYALLFALLAITLALSVGLSVFSLVYKEVLLSQLGRQSTLAFYAADTGIECGLYWGFQGYFDPTRTNPAAITCVSQVISTGSQTNVPLDPPCPAAGSSKIGGSGPGACPNYPPNTIAGYPNDSATSTFMVLLNPSSSSPMNGPCVVVRIGETTSGTTKLRHLEARGYNICNPNDPLRVERGLYTDFK